MRTLKKSRNKKICGVCAGLAEYFGIDVTIVRLIVIILILGCGSGLLAYIIAALVMPEADSEGDSKTTGNNKSDENIENLKSANLNKDEEKKSSGSSSHSDEAFDNYFKTEK